MFHITVTLKLDWWIILVSLQEFINTVLFLLVPTTSVVGIGGELHRTNSLWNTLVALHRESRENWDDARRAASISYSEKMDELE